MRLTRVACLLTILSMALASSGCTTALVWAWAKRPLRPGKPVSVIREGKNDLVLIHIRENPNKRGGYYAFRIPKDWIARPRHGNDRFNWLNKPLECEFHAVKMTRAQRRGQRLPQRKITQVRVSHSTDPPGSPFAVVQVQIQPRMWEMQLYGYDYEAQTWVQLGRLDTGMSMPSQRRIWTARALTPLTLTLDVVLPVILLLEALGCIGC